MLTFLGYKQKDGKADNIAIEQKYLKKLNAID